MNPVIVIESSTNEQSAPPREVLCSVWPISQNGDELIIGKPIFSNHMVSVGMTVHNAFNSILELPEGGTYLIEIGYPNGQSLRTTISVSNGEKYSLEVEALKQIPLMSFNKRRAISRIPVVSAAPKHVNTKKVELVANIITQQNQVSLSELYEFVSNLKSSTKDWENIFRASNRTEVTLELPLAKQPIKQLRALDKITERNWIVVGSEKKHQILLSYPNCRTCENYPQFKLMMECRNKTSNKENHWSASLKLMDPVYGSLIEYLTRRDLLSTRSISESQRGKETTALYKRVENPFSVAAAAYVVALTESENSMHDSWMETLSSRYTWLPDGAIALGWKTLRDGQSNLRAWKEAKELISLACSRGLPYYTVGLHILVDALTLLTRINPNDEEILRMLAAAKAADVACIRTEPFTTLQISRYLGLPMRRT